MQNKTYTEKACSKCGQVKPPVQSHGRARAQEEKAEYDRAYRLVHREERAEYNRLYSLTHREEEAEHRRIYYLAHREEHAEYNRLYCQAHRKEKSEHARTSRLARHEEAVERDRTSRLAHREERAEYSHIYRLAHREECAEYGRLYALAHPNKFCDQSARRRALRRAAHVEPVSRVAVFTRDGGRCHVCGKKANPKKWHLDHLIPLSLGGEHSYKNVAVSCPTCNLQRGNRGPAQLRLPELGAGQAPR